MKLFPISGLALLGLFCSLAGCKKSNEFASYIKGSLDGVPFAAAYNITTNKTAEGSPPQVYLSGEWPGYSLRLIISGEGSAVTTGDYVLQADKHSSITFWEGQNGYYAGPEGLFLPPRLYGSGNITITEFSKNYIRGFFEFVSDPQPATALVKSISGGEFYIRRPQGFLQPGAGQSKGQQARMTNKTREPRPGSAPGLII